MYRLVFSLSLATSCEELTHWKRLWCWEGLGAGEEGDDRGWDGWMASLTRWMWVWMNSGSWWWTGRPGVLRFMGLQRVRHDWATELNWIMIFLQNWKILRNFWELEIPRNSELFHPRRKFKIANELRVRDKKYFGSKFESTCVWVGIQHTGTSDLSYYLANQIWAS